jgi:hypothetical protein
LPDDSKVGRKIRCRECEEPFVIEEAEGETEQRPARPAKSRQGAGGLPPRAGGAKTKKKKTKSDENDAPQKPKRKSKSGVGKSPAFVGGICVLVLGLLIGLPLLFSGGEEPMKPPESYAKFSHDVKQTFQIEYPEGWTVESGGQSGQAVWAKFSKGEDVRIRVRSSMGASAVGDIAASAARIRGDEEESEEEAPVAKVHEMMMEQFGEEYDEYRESAPVKIETGFGDTRMSEFTASGSWGSKMRGIRASMLGLNLQYTVICDCPEEDWEVCRPVFERIIKSMSRG